MQAYATVDNTEVMNRELYDTQNNGTTSHFGNDAIYMLQTADGTLN